MEIENPNHLRFINILYTLYNVARLTLDVEKKLFFEMKLK